MFLLDLRNGEREKEREKKHICRGDVGNIILRRREWNTVKVDEQSRVIKCEKEAKIKVEKQKKTKWMKYEER